MANKFSPLQIEPRDGEGVDQYIRRFIKKVRDDGIHTDVRDRQYAMSKGQRRRYKEKKALYRLQKQKVV
jgi:ribosomal protein S21